MAQLFTEWWIKNFDYSLFHKSSETRMRNFRLLIGIGWNCAEVCGRFCAELVRANGLDVLIEALNSAMLSPRHILTDPVRTAVF